MWSTWSNLQRSYLGFTDRIWFRDQPSSYSLHKLQRVHWVPCPFIMHGSIIMRISLALLLWELNLYNLFFIALQFKTNLFSWKHKLSAYLVSPIEFTTPFLIWNIRWCMYSTWLQNLLFHLLCKCDVKHTILRHIIRFFLVSYLNVYLKQKT